MPINSLTTCCLLFYYLPWRKPCCTSSVFTFLFLFFFFLLKIDSDWMAPFLGTQHRKLHCCRQTTTGSAQLEVLQSLIDSMSAASEFVGFALPLSCFGIQVLQGLIN